MCHDQGGSKGRWERRGECKICSNYPSDSPRKSKSYSEFKWHKRKRTPKSCLLPSHQNSITSYFDQQQHVTCAFTIHSWSHLDLEGNLPWAESSHFLYFCINLKSPLSSGNTAVLSRRPSSNVGYWGLTLGKYLWSSYCVSGIILGMWYSQRMKQTPLPAWTYTLVRGGEGRGVQRPRVHGTHCSVLAGEPRGQRSLAGYQTRGHRESDTTECLNHHQRILSFPQSFMGFVMSKGILLELAPKQMPGHIKN